MATNNLIAYPLKFRYSKGQQALVSAVVKLGWNLDSSETLNDYYGGWGRPDFSELPAAEQNQYLSQHPFIFVKPAADGGTWQLELDYQSRERYSQFNKTLQAAKLRHFAADGTETVIPGFSTVEYTFGGKGNYPGRSDSNIGAAWLKHPGIARGRSTNWLWEATRDEDGSYNLREQVIKLATNPELVLWRAAEKLHNQQVRLAEQQAEKKADREARQRPLAPSWKQLRRAAYAIVTADGKSDAVALLDALKAAVAIVEEEVVVR